MKKLLFASQWRSSIRLRAHSRETATLAEIQFVLTLQTLTDSAFENANRVRFVSQDTSSKIYTNNTFWADKSPLKAWTEGNTLAVNSQQLD